MLDTSASSPSPAMFLSRTLVLIPALNEAECIQQTVKYWRSLSVAAVRVVDNGSTDRTAELAADAGATVIREPRRGYGADCWTGLEKLPTHVEWILFSSADSSDRLSAADLERWSQHVEAGVEFLMGNRFSAPESRRHLKWVQRVGNRLCVELIRLGWGARFDE